MAFCGKCGAQLSGNEQFCPSCGHDVSAAAAPAGAPVAAPAPVAPPPEATPSAAPPVAPYPQYYPPPGQIPIVAPQAVPAHHGGAWWVVIIAAALFGFWWIGTHDQPNQPAGTTPTPPATTPTPGAAPTPAPQPGGSNAALVAQQNYTTQWSVVNGDVQLSNQQWVNQSNVAIQSADMECDQYDQNGSDLAQKHVQLTDQTGAAVKPGETEQFGNLDIGPAVAGLTKVNCGIVAVTPAATPTQ